MGYIMMTTTVHTTEFAHMEPVTLELLVSQHVCPGKTIELQCITRSTTILTWEINEIGTHIQRVEFFLSDNPGTRHNITNSGGFAEVLNVTQTENLKEIVSTLHVVASLTHPNPSITCINAALNTSITRSFSVVGDPEAIQLQYAIQYASPSQDGTCILFVLWWPLTAIDPVLSINYTESHNLTTVPAALHMSCGYQTIWIQARDSCNRSTKTPKRVVTSILKIPGNVNSDDTQLSAAASFTLKSIPMTTTIVLICLLISEFLLYGFIC